MYAASCFASKPGPLLSPSLIWLRSTPVPGDHGEGQVLAVLALDRGDKSICSVYIILMTSRRELILPITQRVCGLCFLQAWPEPRCYSPLPPSAKHSSCRHLEAVRRREQKPTLIKSMWKCWTHKLRSVWVSCVCFSCWKVSLCLVLMCCSHCGDSLNIQGHNAVPRRQTIHFNVNIFCFLVKGNVSLVLFCTLYSFLLIFPVETQFPIIHRLG